MTITILDRDDMVHKDVFEVDDRCYGVLQPGEGDPDPDKVLEALMDMNDDEAIDIDGIDAAIRIRPNPVIELAL